MMGRWKSYQVEHSKSSGQIVKDQVSDIQPDMTDFVS